MVKFSAVKRLVFSVRSRVAVFALAATILPSATLGWLSYQRNAEVLAQKTAQELDAGASVAAREIDLWMKDRTEEMRIFGSSYLITENLERLAALEKGGDASMRRQVSSRMRDYLASVTSRFPGFAGLRVVAPDGSVIYSSHRDPVLNLPEHWLRATASGRVVIGEPYWSAGDESTIVGIAVPVRSGRGQALGALVASVNAKAIGEILSRSARDATRIHLIDHGGRPIGPGMPATTEAGVEPHGFQTAAFREYRNALGIDVVGVFRPVAEQVWGVVAERDRDLVFFEVNELRNTTFKLLLLLLVAVGIGAYWIGQTIVKPLDRLIAAANRVATGDLDLTVPIQQRDELGHLTERFNEMTGQLRRNREELASANDELIRKNIELEAISITDSLTSLYNRRHMMNVLEREFQQVARNGQTFTLMMIDLDHFKAINDSYGHPAGDAVLVTAARILRDAVRGVDYAARFGGEEFIVLLTDTGADEAEASAERIRSRLADGTISHGDDRITVTASIGLAEVIGAGDTPGALIARADAALYEAKQQGRNRVCRHQAKVHILHKSGKA